MRTKHRHFEGPCVDVHRSIVTIVIDILSKHAELPVVSLSLVHPPTMDLVEAQAASTLGLADGNLTWSPVSMQMSMGIKTTDLNTSFSSLDEMDYTEGIQMERIISIVVPVLFGLVVLIGLVGNALVVVVVICNQQMRNTTNILIINLALADLLFIIFCVPFTATDYALPVWPFGDLWCRVVQYLLHVCAYASVYTLVLMSLDRFMAVVLPITSMSMRTVRNTWVAISILWSVILFSCIPVYFAHGTLDYTYSNTDMVACVFLQKEGYSNLAFQISFFLTSYLVPLTLICALYLLMLKRLWHGVAPGGHISEESKRSKKRVTRLVIIVVFTFALCWCPIQIVLLCKSLDMYTITPVKVVIQIIAHVLAYTSSCVNPILYAFLSENFRKAFRKVVACYPAPSPPVNTRHVNGERSETRCMITKTTTPNESHTNDIV